MNKKIFWSTTVLTWLLGSVLSLVYAPQSIMKMVEFKMRQEVGVNQFFHRTRLSTHADVDVVRPNNDTLYSSAWIDLSSGPVSLQLPDMQGRYFSFQFLRPDTSVFEVIGTRKTGENAESVLIVGPNWQGCLSPHTILVEAKSNEYWLLGRTLVEGENDLTAAAAVLQQYRLNNQDQCS